GGLGKEIDSAALEREPRRGTRAIAGDVFEGHAEHVHGEPQPQVLGRIDAQAADDETSGVDDVGRMLQPGRHVGTREVDGRAGLRGDELVALEVDAKAFGIERVHEGGAGEISRHGAVARRDFAQIFGADDAAGAVHVLNHDVGLTLDVAGKMLGKQPALDVGRPAGGEVDQDGEALAAVERFIGRGGRRGDRSKRRRAEPRHRAHQAHCDPPAGGRLSPKAYPCLRGRGSAVAGMTTRTGRGTTAQNRFEEETPCWKKLRPATSTPMTGRTTTCASSSPAPNAPTRSCASRAPTGSWKWARWPR